MSEQDNLPQAEGTTENTPVTPIETDVDNNETTATNKMKKQKKRRK